MADPRRFEVPPPVTWDAVLGALESTRAQGFALVQVRTSLPGDGYEVFTVTVRRPERRSGG